MPVSFRKLHGAVYTQRSNSQCFDPFPEYTSVEHSSQGELWLFVLEPITGPQGTRDLIGERELKVNASPVARVLHMCFLPLVPPACYPLHLSELTTFRLWPVSDPVATKFTGLLFRVARAFS